MTYEDTPRARLQRALDEVGDRATYVRVEVIDLRAFLSGGFTCQWCPGDGRGDHAVDCAKRETHPLDPRRTP